MKLATVLIIVLSGYLSEDSGPDEHLRKIGNDVAQACTNAGYTTSVSFFPYSIFPAGLRNVTINSMIAEYGQVILIGHSFGGAAVKWLCDRIHDAGLIGKVLFACMIDGVPEQARFAEYFNDMFSDFFPFMRWGFPVDIPFACQLYQRHDLFPRGTQIRDLMPPKYQQAPHHWNIDIKSMLGTDDGHANAPSDPIIQFYIVKQAEAALAWLAYQP